MSNKETFQNNVNLGANNVTQSTNPGIVDLNTSLTTESTYQDMDELDVENSEKIIRDIRSNDLNNCIGKYINRPIKALRGVSELINSKSDGVNNIYDFTKVKNNKVYFEQYGYW
jgi:hypothetical protein